LALICNHVSIQFFETTLQKNTFPASIKREQTKFIVAGTNPIRISLSIFLSVRAFEQVQLTQFAAKSGEVPEGLLIFWVWHSWEVDLQELFVFLAVARAVKDGVDVVEDVERGKGQFECCGYCIDDCLVQVWGSLLLAIGRDLPSDSG
jgi:hypothetical protein